MAQKINELSNKSKNNFKSYVLDDVSVFSDSSNKIVKNKIP